MDKNSQPWNFPEDTVEIIDKEPGVINSAMISEAYAEMKDGPLNDIFDFNKIEDLKLEFFDIMTIDHLSMCTQLTKLSLSNNVIKEIANLAKLVNLVSLNLSFNRITQIKGLEALGKLEELSLFNNEITVVENLEKQISTLRLLSLGCNKIQSSHCLIYLRKFKNLSSLNLEGNPFIETAHYDIVEMVGGLLPHVDYYNYRMIRSPQREQGRAKLRSLLEKLSELEANEELQNKIFDFKKLLSSYLEKAFISGFNGDEFYDKMMSRDHEGRRIDHISDQIAQVFERLKRGLRDASQNIIKYGVSFYNQRKSEVQLYKNSYTEDMLAITHQSTVVIRDFMTAKSKLLKTLVSLYVKEGVNDENAEMRMRQAIICDKDYTLCRRKAWWDLIEQEMLRHDKNESNLVVFEDKLVELGKSFSEEIRVEFLTMRNIEEEYHVSLLDQVNHYLVEMHMNKEPVPLPENFKSLLLNKEKREKIISRSHANHLSDIDMEEEKLLNKVKEWQATLIEKFCLAEIERNRRAILEINKFVSHHKKDWAALTGEALTNAYSFMKAVDPNWTHELIRIKMNSKERMLDDQMEAIFRERFQATAMRKRMEIQVKEETGDAECEQAQFASEEKKELEIRSKRKAYRFAYGVLLKRDTQMDSIYQMWNSAEDLTTEDTEIPESTHELEHLLDL